jgi:hypothetical protein
MSNEPSGGPAPRFDPSTGLPFPETINGKEVPENFISGRSKTWGPHLTRQDVTDFTFGYTEEQGGPPLIDVPYTTNSSAQPEAGPGDTGQITQRQRQNLTLSITEMLEDQSDRLERIEVALADISRQAGLADS